MGAVEKVNLRWPKQLPCGLRAGYSLSTADPVRRTEMENGRFRARRVFKDVPTTASISWLMTSKQAQIFELFHDSDLNGGVLPFDIPLLTPLGMEYHTVRFVEMFSGPELAANKKWKYSAKIQLLKRAILPAELSTMNDLIFDQDILDLSLNREWDDFKAD